MGDVPLGLAVAAGAVAAVNPCGFALLPAYLSVLVRAGDDDPARGAALVRALTATAAITSGFAAVFLAFGLVLAPVADLIQRQLPWFTVAFGLAVAVAGGWVLAGRDLPGFTRWAGRGPALTRSLLSMMLFGAAYALASLGCTIGPFLAIVVSSLRAGSVLDGIVLFLAYALGMGVLVGTAAVAVALARTALIGRLRRLAMALSRTGGAIMLLAGSYVAYYGWYEVRLLGGGEATDPVIAAATAAQGWLADAVDNVGPATIAATFVATVLACLVLARLARRRGGRRTSALHIDSPS